MAKSTEWECRIDALVRELEEEFGEFPESDEPLITQIEDRAIAIGDAVITRVIRSRLPSKRSGDARECCPTCGRSGRRRGTRRRWLQTRRGKVELEEIEWYCSACRKSFFPAAQTAGDRA